MQISKKIEGGPFGDTKIRKSHSAKKTRGDPIVSSGVLAYVKNEINERGDPLHQLSAYRSSVSTMHTLLSDEKKLVTVTVGLFSLKENAPTKNTLDGGIAGK